MRVGKKQISRQNLEIKKTIHLSVVINSLQILMMLLILLDLVVFEPAVSTTVRLITLITFLVVSGGAVVDIWDALAQRRVLGQIDDMDATIEDLEKLNTTIRSQRHDFLNHLQVVYSLMEMEEYQEAGDYIEKVYGSITSLSRVLRTANAPVNALLQAKLSACESLGIRVEMNIQSRWESLPMPGWEMCKVLSNLIDNAMDALQEISSDKKLVITLTEDLHAFRFNVSNNGPMIPVKSWTAIFNPGVSGKGSGRGMGLHIVRQTLQKYGGDIEVTSEPETTSFAGFVPRELKTEESA